MLSDTSNRGTGWFCSSFHAHAGRAYQPPDFRENATGRWCGGALWVRAGLVSCEDCCTLRGVTPDSVVILDGGRDRGSFYDHVPQPYQLNRELE